MNRALTWILLGGLAALIGFSLYLAAMRIFQVDECCNIYVARLIATGEAKTTPGQGVELFQFLLSWLGRGATRSIDLFVSARFVMVELFWLNVVLIALATGERLFSRPGVLALAGAATLAPLWDYGFEVRHDNLILTGVLLAWCSVRIRPAGLQSYALAGAIAVALQFVAFKSFVYTVPIAVAILAFPHPGYKVPRWKLALAWAAGAGAMFLLVRLVYGVAGLWEGCVASSQHIATLSSSGHRFGPDFALSRLLSQTPLVSALWTAGCVAVGADLWRRRKAALNWEGNLPELLLCGVALAALIINPTPFPYNLLHVVPYVFLVAFRYAADLARKGWVPPRLLPATAAVLVFTHLVPFGVATRRHLDWSNSRQDGLMRLAEDLTDPAKDPVYDGTGLVPTRPTIDPRSFLHSLVIDSFIQGPGPRIRDMLAVRPAAVILPSYRTDWLPEEDHAFIRERYVAIADDFLVLGKVLPAGGGTFEITHPGRYRIASWQGSDLAGSYPEGWKGLLTPEDQGSLTGTLDGLPIPDQPVELTVGIHRIESTPDCQPTVVWVGPQLNRIHRRGQGNHRGLFVNWY